jgi:hypothetical protein
VSFEQSFRSSGFGLRSTPSRRHGFSITLVTVHQMIYSEYLATRSTHELTASEIAAMREVAATAAAATTEIHGPMPGSSLTASVGTISRRTT